MLRVKSAVLAGLCMWLFWLPYFGNCAKFLLVPVPLFSHCVEITGVGQKLVDRGHEVSIFIGSNFEHKNCFKKLSNGSNEIKPIIFKSKPGSESLAQLSLSMSDLAKDQDFNPLTKLDKMKEFMDTTCIDTIWDKERILKLKEENFDLIIVDGFTFGYCTFVIPYALRLPYVSISTVYDDFVTGKPVLFSVSPFNLSRFTSDMTFLQRLANSMMWLFMHELTKWFMPMNLIQDFDPSLTKSDMVRLSSQAELFLYNADVVLGYPTPTMPNHINVGGIATDTAKPLSGEVKKFYTNAPNGVIVVSFGSLFGRLPDNVEDNLRKALKRFDEKVLWKYLKEGEDGNIKTLRWLPQNDLLGHPKTKLLVSHCGNNGLYEAVFHGVPVLCTPLFADQFFNAGRVSFWETGGNMNLITATEDEIYEAIFDVLNSPVYSQNIKKASAMFHSRPMSPGERAAFWVEHVLKFGGQHLRSKGTTMPAYQFLGYDILLFIMFVLFVTIYVSFKCLQICLRRCTRKTTKLKKN